MLITLRVNLHMRHTQGGSDESMLDVASTITAGCEWHTERLNLMQLQDSVKLEQSCYPPGTRHFLRDNTCHRLRRGCIVVVEQLSVDSTDMQELGRVASARQVPCTSMLVPAW